MKNLNPSNKWVSQNSPISCLLTFLIIGSAVVSDAKAQLTAAIETSQSSYVLGQRVELTLTAFNDSNQDITLSFPSTFQATYILDDVLSPIVGGAFFSKALVPARGSHSWDFAVTGIDVGHHQVAGYIAPHTIMNPSAEIEPATGNVALHADSGTGNGLETDPIFFEVTTPEPIVDDVFIDFESYPDGTPTRGPNGTRGIWEDAYAQWGVRLNTSGDSTSSLGINLDDNFSSDNTILETFLSQRAIKAEFDMPVFEVSATVGSAQGRSVTMTLFDNEGNTIDFIESAGVENYPELVGTLKLASSVPIAAVEWAASDPLAGVRIDDIFLDVRPIPEPTSLCLIISGVLFGLGRRIKN